MDFFFLVDFKLLGLILKLQNLINNIPHFLDSGVKLLSAFTQVHLVYSVFKYKFKYLF